MLRSRFLHGRSYSYIIPTIVINYKIKMIKVASDTIAVDYKSDIKKVEKLL